MSLPDPGRRLRPYVLWGGFTWAFILAPLCAFDYLPSADLPHHLAISSVLWRLAHADPAVAENFAFNPQPVPYYGAYGFLVPAVGFLGPSLAARLFFASLGLCCTAAAALCMRQARVPACFLLTMVFVFFGPLFYCGFVVTMAGLPCLLVMLWSCWRTQDADARPRHAVIGAVAALLAILSHAVLALPVAIIAAAAAWARWGRPVPTKFSLFALCFAMGGAAWLSLDPPDVLEGVFSPAGLDLQWDYFKGFLGPFDHGLGRLAHVGVLICCSVAAWQTVARRASGPRLTRALAWAAGALVVAFALCPRAVHGPGMQAWGMAIRFVVFAELLLVVLARNLSWPRLLPATLVGLTCLHAVAQWRFFATFEQRAAPLLQALQALPPGHRLAVEKNGSLPMLKAWPPVLTHLDLYYLAAGGVCSSDILTGAHLPIRAVGGCSPRPGEYLFQQSDGHQVFRQSAPADATLVASQPNWRLLRMVPAPS